jgi:hypothetical protein
VGGRGNAERSPLPSTPLFLMQLPTKDHKEDGKGD